MLTAGESHGPCLVVIVDGLPAGLEIDINTIDRDLARRQRGYGRNKRMEIESDHVEILGGVIGGKTIGAPIALKIENRDWINWCEHWAAGDLPRLMVPRPGHADYAGLIKYGLNDIRLVLERASARETAARVAAGAIVKSLLAEFGISIGSYVTEIGSVTATIPELIEEDLWIRAEASDVHCPDVEASNRMKEAIDAAREAGDTLGGVFVVIAEGVMIGLGSYVQWERRLDARLAAAIMSIPGIKGVEIGPAFENARLPGSIVHDDMYPGDDGNVKRLTNRAGGLEGGVTNGESIVVRGAMKPISTTANPHNSVDMTTSFLEEGGILQPAKPFYQRSDFCAVPAASIIAEAMVAWTLAEAVVEKFGGDSLAEMKR
jgi:chorismate synthase